MPAPVETIFDLLDPADDSCEIAFSIEDAGVRLDARLLRQRVEQRARELVLSGVRRGDRVLLSATNSADWVVSFLSVMRSGAIVAPVNPAATHRERCVVAEIVEPEGVIADAPDVWGGIATILSVSDGSAERPASDSRGVRLPTLAATDRALILFTSGTTGRPKAAVQSHSTLLYAGQGTAYWLALGARDVLLTCLPLFHANGIYYSLMGALAARARLHVAPRFSVSSFWQTVRQAGATEVNLLGPMLSMLLRQPATENDAENPLQLVYTAAAPVQACAEFSRRFNVEIVEGYGMTETPYGCINPRGTGKPGSIGLPRQHPTRAFENSVAVVADNGEAVPERAVGEIVIRNAATIVEYWKDPATTAAAFRGGWLRTGDLGYRDADGYFFIVGRSKEIIRRKGVNIAPAEIEALLLEVPGVDDAALIGMPSELGEEVAIAVVVVDPRLPRDGMEERILMAIRQRVSREKWPDEVVLTDVLPKTPTHRVEKGMLKKWLQKRKRSADAKDHR